MVKLHKIADKASPNRKIISIHFIPYLNKIIKIRINYSDRAVEERELRKGWI